MKILITGSAGFIGFHLAKKLSERGDIVFGIDNLNDYYDINLKYGRLKETGIDIDNIKSLEAAKSTKYNEYRFIKMDLQDRNSILKLFEREKFDKVCHLAAQAGVRYSLINPYVYIESNIMGFMNILEACHHTNIKNLVYASSSSVYGLNENMPFSTHDNVDHPVSLYAASKKSNELMAHSYSYLYGLPTTGLRFFTVYGPWGRPDMALFIFTKAILEGRAIDIYNFGEMERDFTYIDDIINGVIHSIDKIPESDKNWNGKKNDPSRSIAPFRIYNIGNNSPVKLLFFVETIEEILGKKSVKNFLPLQMGDVPKTWADSTDLMNDMGYKPNTDIKDGIRKFIEWYLDFYRE
jgi:UDP-glucuronate 4-epimerase